MSRAKYEQAICYIGDQSEFGTATKLQENLARRVPEKREKIALYEFGTKGQSVPNELILLAHSDTTRTTIGGKTPVELAQELNKQFHGKDKTRLQSIKLVACEGGYGDHPLALALAKELHKQGFTLAVVKSATHPEQSRIGGVVSVTTHAGISRMMGHEDGQLTAVMYGNQKTVDYIRWKELHHTRGVTKKPPKGWTEELEQERSALVLKHNDFTGFDEKHPDYCVIKLAGDINDLDAPYNCYTKDGVQAPINIDAAIALDTLREQRGIYDRLNDAKTVTFINKVIDEINKNPSASKNQILKILSNDQFKKNSTVRSIVVSSITEAIDTKLEAMDPNKTPTKVETIASNLEKKKDYYERLLAKDSILDKLWRSIYGTDNFTNGLRKRVLRISHDTLLLKATREDIIGRIENQQKLDNSKLTATIHIGLMRTKKTTNTPLENLYETLNDYCTKTNPTAEDWAQVQTAKQKYEQDQPQDKKSEALEALIQELDTNNKLFASIETNLGVVQTEVINAITAYLTKYDKNNEPDDTHKPKVAVMKAIQAYVHSPSKEQWEKLEQSTRDNPGWDKGLFSKVRFMMSEARKVHGEQEQLEKDIFSPTPRSQR